MIFEITEEQKFKLNMNHPTQFYKKTVSLHSQY